MQHCKVAQSRAGYLRPGCTGAIPAICIALVAITREGTSCAGAKVMNPDLVLPSHSNVQSVSLHWQHNLSECVQNTRRTATCTKTQKDATTMSRLPAWYSPHGVAYRNPASVVNAGPHKSVAA